jgi:hypothetical protein
MGFYIDPFSETSNSVTCNYLRKRVLEFTCSERKYTKKGEPNGPALALLNWKQINPISLLRNGVYNFHLNAYLKVRKQNR